MSSKESVWRELNSECDIDLFIDIEIDLAEELIFSSELIGELAFRGIRLLFGLECISTKHSVSYSVGKLH